MEEQNFFVYSDDNKGMQFCTGILYSNKQARTVFNLIIMGSKHKVLGLRPNYGGLGAKSPTARSNRGLGAGAPVPQPPV